MRIHVPAICFLFFSFTHSVEYHMARKINLTEESTTLNVFVTENAWKHATIAAEKRKYTEAFLSKAFYHWECEHEVQVIPVYFYPGETVRIECVMCNVALVLNGSPKGWARIKSIDSFIENSKRLDNAEMVQNSEFLENEDVIPNPRQLGEPYYYQQDGFLIIQNANSYSQGVYFCFDEDSVASQRHFYVLIPLLPVFHVAKEHSDQMKNISGGCSDSERSFPHHFWGEIYEKELFDDRETCSKRYGNDNWSCRDLRTSTRPDGCENPASSCRSRFSAPTLPEDVYLIVSLRWAPWSECKGGKQKRIGQCFLGLGSPLSGAVPEKWNWVQKLNRLSDAIAFREGIPLFSGLLASWLYGVDRLDSCLDAELGANATIEGYHDFFSNVFHSVLNITGKLRTPENAFKYCFRYQKIEDKYDSLVGTDSVDKRSC